MKKDLDRTADKRFTMQTCEMTKGKTTTKGAQVARDLHKRMKKSK